MPSGQVHGLTCILTGLQHSKKQIPYIIQCQKNNEVHGMSKQFDSNDIPEGL